MHSKDYILTEIEKMALVIARLLGFKEAGKTDEFIKLADSTLLNNYNIKLDEILALDIDAFELLLKNENYSADKLDALAQLLYIYSLPFTANAELLLSFKKILLVYDVLEQQYHRQSFENINKRNTIYQFLQTNYE